MRKMIPVAQRVLGGAHQALGRYEDALKISGDLKLAKALYLDASATLDDLRESVELTQHGICAACIWRYIRLRGRDDDRARNGSRGPSGTRVSAKKRASETYIGRSVLNSAAHASPRGQSAPSTLVPPRSGARRGAARPRRGRVAARRRRTSAACSVAAAPRFSRSASQDRWGSFATSRKAWKRPEPARWTRLARSDRGGFGRFAWPSASMPSTLRRSMSRRRSVCDFLEQVHEKPALVP